jgi:hypothetical protein
MALSLSAAPALIFNSSLIKREKSLLKAIIDMKAGLEEFNKRN